MLTRYRIIQKRDRRGQWRPIGAVYERMFDSGNVYPLPVAGPGEQKVNWRDWQAIDQKTSEYGLFGPPLEEYDQVFADHADRYRLSHEIYALEGESYPGIRAWLYQRYVLDPTREEEAEEPAITYLLPAEKALAGVQAVREGTISNQGGEHE